MNTIEIEIREITARFFYETVPGFSYSHLTEGQLKNLDLPFHISNFKGFPFIIGAGYSQLQAIECLTENLRKARATWKVKPEDYKTELEETNHLLQGDDPDNTINGIYLGIKPIGLVPAKKEAFPKIIDLLKSLIKNIS